MLNYNIQNYSRILRMEHSDAMGAFQLGLKRLFDIVFSVIGLIVLSPIMLVFAIILFYDHGPVIFKQERVGYKGKPFTIYKFRTMRTDAPHDVPTHLMQDPDQWLTRSGKFLRKSSLDELPQLWNIAVTHDISIIGPRPALWNQDDLVAEREKYGANDVRPGLTGWAQVNGRDELAIPEKARLDGEYAQNISFAFDVKCFFRTIGSVLRADGYVDGGPEAKKKDK